MTADLRPYRKGVGLMVINGSQEVFVARRLGDHRNYWQMPQGGIDKGETPKQAALRELWEETNMTSVKVLEETRSWVSYDFPGAISARIWGGEFKGQTQKWFLMSFLGEDGEIDLSAHTPEFCQWKWVPLRTLPDLVIPFKRPLYHQIIDLFQLS